MLVLVVDFKDLAVQSPICPALFAFLLPPPLIVSTRGYIQHSTHEPNWQGLPMHIYKAISHYFSCTKKTDVYFGLLSPSVSAGFQTQGHEYSSDPVSAFSGLGMHRFPQPRIQSTSA